MAVLENLLGQVAPDADRTLDVIFIHGLDGDVFATWQSDSGPDGLWPRWLVGSLPFKVGLWSVGYPAKAIDWRGESQALYERAVSILNLLKVNNIGDRPIIFIVHSLGGLVVKQMLHTAVDLDGKRYKEIQNHTRGIVFLATPHTGARLASVLRRVPFLHGNNIADLVYEDVPMIVEG
jgi:hypothetical protein